MAVKLRSAPAASCCLQLYGAEDLSASLHGLLSKTIVFLFIDVHVPGCLLANLYKNHTSRDITCILHGHGFSLWQVLNP